MKKEDFIEASSYLRVLEKKLLGDDGMNRAADAANASETLKLISQNSGYDFSTLEKPEDYEMALKDELKKTYEMLYNLSGRREIIDIPAAKYDFHNLKAALKAKHLGAEWERLFFSVTDLSAQAVEALVKNGKKDDVPVYVAEAVSDADGAFAETNDPQMIDIIMDRHMFKHMLSLCRKLDNAFITEYVKLSIDFSNIRTLMRVKNMQKGTRFLSECLIEGGLTDKDAFVAGYDKPPESLAAAFQYKHFGDAVALGLEDYAKTKNFSGLEKHLDNCLIDYVKGTKFLSYGAEVLFAYLISKENEVRQIRILVTGKINGVPFEALKERLRDNYA